MQVLGVDNVLFAIGQPPESTTQEALAAAISHYQDHLGLRLKFRLDQPGLAIFSIGTEAPGIVLRYDPSPAAQASGRTPRLWLEVVDALVAASELTLKGTTGVGTAFRTATGWTVEVADPGATSWVSPTTPLAPSWPDRSTQSGE